MASILSCLVLLLITVIITEGLVATRERVVDEADVPAYLLFNRGVELQGQHRLEEALQAYTDAVHLKPDLTEALINAGILIQKNGSYDMAFRLFEEAYRTADLQELRSSALNNLAHLQYLHAGLDYEIIARVVPIYQAAVEHDQTNVDAWYNMGKALEDLGRREEARQAFEMVLALQPDHPGGNLNLGNYYLFQGDAEAAIRHHQRTVDSPGALPRDIRAALSNMGQQYRLLNMHEAALRTFEKSIELDRDDTTAWSNLMVASRTLCDWRDIEEVQSRILGAVKHDLRTGTPSQWRPGGYRGLTPYDSTLMAFMPAPLHLELTRAYLTGLESITRCPLHVDAGPPMPLRVSYLSYDYRDHPMGHLTQGILTSHDTKRFHVIAASYGPNDGSKYRRRIESGVGTFLDLQRRDEMEASCELVAQARPHILVDLMVLTRGTRTGLAALRPAPLVVNYLGYPSTMGASFTNYIMVDQVVAPVETAAHGFSEKVVYLPGFYQANDYPYEAPMRQIPSRSQERASPLVLCNLNNVDKLEPYSFTVWMAILRALPHAVLHLLAPSPPSDIPVQAHLREEAASHGVDPSRIIFLNRVSKDDHLARLAGADGEPGCDLFIDTFIYGAHSTASDALWAGVPLLTIKGWGGPGDVLGKFQSRVGASLLHHLGLGATAAVSVKDFEDMALRIGGIPGQEGIYDSFTAMSQGAALSQQAFNVHSTTANLEQAYHTMWEVYSSGLKPQNLVIGQPHMRSSITDNINGQAVAALREGEPQRALKLTRRVVQGVPGHADGWHLMGLAYLQEGLVTQAVESITKATHLAPDVAFYHQNLAEAYLRAGKLWEAREALVASLSVNPYEVTAATRLQGLLYDQGDCQAEIQAFEQLADFILGSDQPLASEVSRFLQLHAVALVVCQRHEEAITVLRHTLSVFPEDYHAAMKLATSLEEAGHYQEAIDQYMAAVKLKNHVLRSEMGTEVSRVPRRRDRPTLAIYCDEYGQTWWEGWGPSSLGKGLGGSEEAVVFIAREIAKSGRYYVEVYAQPGVEDLGPDKVVPEVTWHPISSYDPGDPADVFVAWRYHISVALGEPSPSRYVWLQDLPSFNTFTQAFLHRYVDGIFCLSQFHMSLLPLHAQPWGLVTPNSLDPSFFVQGPNLPQRFVYGSAPNRGLELVLRSWSKIRSSLVAPEPELWVYYGFTEAFLKYGRRTIPDFDQWMADMQALLQQDGVRYLGMVDHETLAEGFASSGFILYPTAFPETGCITLMKAQAMGAIPITSRYPKSTLPELTGPYDLGPRELHGDSYAQDPEWVSLWIQSVVQASNTDYEERRHLGGLGSIQALRKDMIQAARDRFSWSSVADIWMERFEKDYDKPSPASNEWRNRRRRRHD